MPSPAIDVRSEPLVRSPMASSWTCLRRGLRSDTDGVDRRLEPEGRLDDFGLILNPRFRDSEARDFFTSNVWIEEAYAFWEREFLTVKLGNVYHQFSRLSDNTFYGNIPYFDGFKLDEWLGTDTAKAKLLLAGYRGQNAEVAFLFFRLVSPLVFFAVAGFDLFVLEVLDQPVIVRVGLLIVALYVGVKAPEIFLSNQTGKRQGSIQSALPDALASSPRRW